MEDTQIDETLYALTIPKDFSFPFQPYPIQVDLMKHVFNAIEQKKIAIVESPTGTGKSLSLICATMSWIAANRERVQNAVMTDLQTRLAESMPDEPAWVIRKEVERKQRESQAHEVALEERLAAVREKQAQARSRAQHVRKKQKLAPTTESIKKVPSEEDDSDFAPDEMDESEDGYTPEVRALMKKFRHGPTTSTEDEEPITTKIYYASRTHSQLSQFMNEIRKTKFASMRTVALSGRGNLCINDKIKNASTSNEELNEKCLDAQKKGKERCEFLPPLDEPEKLDDFRDTVLAEIHTVEDMEDLGRKERVCPYYGSRRAIRQAQLVALPYQMVLSKDSRESLAISLAGQVVCIDEAHALIDTILASHSIAIPSFAISNALSCLLVYQKRFQKVLKGLNATFLNQFIVVLSRLDKLCKSWMADRADATLKKPMEELNTTTELVGELRLDQLPVHKLVNWSKESKIARKVSGYSENLAKREEAKPNAAERKQIRVANVAVFHRLQAFILSLADLEKNGRVIFSYTAASSKQNSSASVTLKYMLLNPEDVFRDLVLEARSVVLAGGTMSPLSMFYDQLFSYLPQERLQHLVCGHVVPKDHLLVRALGIGASGTKMEFKFENRGNHAILDELGQSLLNLSNVIPHGVVIFLPSYAFLDQVLARWQSTGLFVRLQKRKQVFSEPKLASETDAVLQAYSNAATDQAGILFAVVGAKLSEGINFSNELCRCVIVVSIPFANANSIDLKERMAYVSSLAKSQPGRKAGPDAGRALYTNLAFRAVNQAIGRAIRHANDWSAIILFDARYANPTSQSLLPKWISSELQVAPSFGALIKDTAAFMRARKVSPPG